MAVMGIDPVAVLLAAVAAFIFGGVYHGVLGKAWMAARGKSSDEAKKCGPPVRMLVISFAGELVIATVLAVPIDAASPMIGLTTGFLVWFAFVVTTLAVNHAYQGPHFRSP